MRYLILLLAGGAALAAIAATGLKIHSSASAAAGAVPLTNVERFVMQANGDDKTCLLEKTGSEGALSHISVAPDCDEMLPGLSGLHYWRDSSNGTVALSTDGRTPAVVFAQADGVAYESIEPRLPIIALMESD